MFGRYILIFFVASVTLRAQTARLNPQKIFDLVRQRVADIVRSAPNYTCVETIERERLASGFQARGGCEQGAFDLLRGTYKTVEHDRLRLDVGVAGDGEVFSWHGQHSFVTNDITKLVNEGPISSGSFFGFIADIFVNGRGHYYYHGVSDVDGKRLAVFTYMIPASVSHYITMTPIGRRLMAYHGRFTADIATGDLYSLSVETDDLPKSFFACSMNQAVTYQNLALNGKTFRIPATVELTSTLLNHNRFMSTTKYTACHEFVGESIIHYNSNPQLIAARDAPESSLPVLPPKLTLKLRLTSPVDSNSAWTGDAVTATLEDTLHGKHGRVIATKGSEVSGRIVQLEWFGGDTPYWLIGLRFDTLHGQDTNFRVALDSKTPIDAADRKSHRLFHSDQFSERDFQVTPQPATGLFRISGDHVRLESGFTSEWQSVRYTAK